MKLKQFFFLFFLIPLCLCAEYSKKYHNYSEKIGKDTAIVVFGWNRPQYFSQAVGALAKNPESESFPIFFFLDGGREAKQSEHVKIIENQRFAKYEIVRRTKNHGVGKHLIDARRFLFDWCGFERVIIIEDDNYIAPNYIALLMNLDQWTSEKFTNVGFVSCWCFDREERSYQDKLAHKNCVRASLDNLWGYLIKKEAWDAIKEDLYFYERNFLRVPYRNRNHERIKNWMQSLFKKPSGVKSNTSPFPYTLFPLIKRKVFQRTWVTSQDAVTLACLYKAGFVYVTTDVNRMINIGKEGFHSNSKFWEERFAHSTLDYFPDDDQITEFHPLPLKMEQK